MDWQRYPGKWIIAIAALLAAGGAVAVTNRETAAPSLARVEKDDRSDRDDDAARGKYLVSITGCNDCHTPHIMGPNGPEPDMTRMLSGHPPKLKVNMPPPGESIAGSEWVWHGTATNTAFAGPWGITYAANLTPDVLTGMGIWTEQNFVNAIRRGKHWGEARAIMPPMPWQAFANMTDEDLKSIYAYLRTIPPVSNQVPDYVAPPKPKSRVN